jgi:glycerol-3-phosphate dehydrogenase
MKAKLCAHTCHIVAEAAYAVQRENAFTLADVLLRRVPVGLAGCWSEECSRMAAGRVGVALGWTEAQVRTEFERFESERNAFLVKPESVSGTTSE